MASRQKSYCHSPRKQPFIGVTIGHKLYIEAERHPNGEMYVFNADNERKTFAQMRDESQNLAGSLLQLGLRKGDTLAIMGNSHSESVLASYACMQIGVITVHPRLEFEFTGNKLQALLRKIRCKGLFLTRSPENLLETLKNAIPDMEDIKDPQDFKSKSLPDLRFIISSCRNMDSNNLSSCYSLASVLSKANDDLRTQVVDICLSLDCDDPCSIFFTSGSTGQPKGPVRSHHSLMNSASSVYRYGVEGFQPDWNIRFAMTSSLSSGSSLFGMFIPLLNSSATTVIPSPTYNTASLANAMQDERCTEVMIFIHHLSELLSLPNLHSYDFSSLQLIALTGSIMAKPLRSRAFELAKYVTNLYGATEMLGTLRSNPKDPQDVLDKSAVYPIGGIEVKIVDDDGAMLPVNTRGKVFIRGYSLFHGYWMDEEKTKAAIDERGWFHTGDLGTMDERGFIKILGRDSELIIIKEAQNLAPMELETVLYEHEAVEDALVVGVPDERSYEEVCVCIKLRKPHGISEDDVRQYCKNKVASLLVPKYVLFVETFPTTSNGKFHRRRMAETAMTLLGRSQLS